MTLILVVDDVPIVREPIAAALERAGYRTAMAADGRTALSLMMEEPPALVLLDVSMPAFDGIMVLRAMKSIPQTAIIPVILLTASADRSTIMKARQLGVQDYLLKSHFSMTELLARVRNRLADPSANRDRTPTGS